MMDCEHRREELKALVSFASAHQEDQLPDHLVEIARHVEQCESCQLALSTMTDALAPFDSPLEPELDEITLPESRLSQLKKLAIPVSRQRDSGTDAIHLAGLLDETADDGTSPPDGELGRIGRYRVHAVIGRGGMAVVFGAWDPKLQRHVAIKTLAPAAADSAAQKRFVCEARAVAAIEHANVIAIHEVIERPERTALVMPVMLGGTLQQRLSSAGPLEIREAAEIGVQIASALDAAHASKLIHRDVKPANILFDGEGNAVLADFGLVWDHDRSLTAEDVIPGTPEYICPEQITLGYSTEQSDVYQLGMTLYAAMTGRPAFVGPCAQVLSRVVSETPMPLRKLRGDADRDLETIVMCALEREPSHRYASAGAMCDDLQSWLDGRPVAVVRRGPLAKIAFRCNKHPTAAIVSAAVPLAIVCLLLMTLNLWRSRDAARSELADRESRVEVLAREKQAADMQVELMQSQALQSVLASRTIQMPTRQKLSQNLMLKFAESFEVTLQQELDAPVHKTSAGPSALTLASLYARGGVPEKAAPLFDLALKHLNERRDTVELSNDTFWDRLAMCHRDAALNCLDLNQVQRASDLAAEACQLYAERCRRDPDDLGLALDRAMADTTLARVEIRRDNMDAAQARLHPIADQLLQLQPQVREAIAVPNVHHIYVQACGGTADALESLDRFDVSGAIREACVDSWSAYRGSPAGNTDDNGFHRASHADAMISWARLLQRQGQSAKAKRLADQAVELLESIPTIPQLPRYFDEDIEAARELQMQLHE